MENLDYSQVSNAVEPCQLLSTLFTKKKKKKKNRDVLRKHIAI